MELCRVIETPALLIFPAIMLTAAFMDLFSMTIPNRISLALLLGFAAVAPFSGLGWHALLMHLGVGAGMLAVGIALFVLRLVGGGDAKLLAASALWIGPDHVLPYLANVAICGGLLSVAILFYRYTIPHFAVVWAAPSWALRLHDKNCGIPYGIAIAAAAIVVYPTTALFLSLAV